MTQNRTATVSRKTKETDITVTVGLDGTGKSDIQTGIGFFDHMLESFSKHSAIDLTVRCDGDLHIDMHHSVEDTGIVIGQAILKALGDFAGITRFGTAYIPMDETLSRASLDLCKRPYLVWKVQFTRDKIGEMDTELFKEFKYSKDNGDLMVNQVTLLVVLFFPLPIANPQSCLDSGPGLLSAWS